jgi:hypothetical protein
LASTLTRKRHWLLAHTEGVEHWSNRLWWGGEAVLHVLLKLTWLLLLQPIGRAGAKLLKLPPLAS